MPPHVHPQRSRGASRGARLTAAAAKEVAPLRQPPSRIREEELLLQQESFSYARPRTAEEVAAAVDAVPVDHFRHASLMTTHASERRAGPAGIFREAKAEPLERAHAFKPDKLVFQSPFTASSATATVSQARAAAEQAVRGEGHAHLLQPRHSSSVPSPGSKRRGEVGGVHAAPTSARQALDAASHFARDVLAGTAVNSTLRPGSRSDADYLRRLGWDSAILARSRPPAQSTARRPSSGKWSIGPTRPSTAPSPGPREARLGAVLAATLPPPGTQGKMYGLPVRGTSHESKNPFLRCPPLFEDVVQSSTSEFPVRPGTGRQNTPSHPPLGEYIRGVSGGARQRKLGGDDPSAEQLEGLQESAPADAFDDGGASAQAWWRRATRPSTAAMLSLAQDGDEGAAAEGEDGRPLTKDRANTLFRRRLHETVAGLAADVHASATGIIQTLSSYLDPNWRPPELADGSTFMQSGPAPESVATRKLRSGKKYVPYALYAKATDLRQRKATSRERNRGMAHTLATPLRVTKGRRALSPTDEDSGLAALTLPPGATSLIQWPAGSPLPDARRSGEQEGEEALELDARLPEEGGADMPLLDEPISTTTIYNPYHTPIINADLPPAATVKPPTPEEAGQGPSADQEHFDIEANSPPPLHRSASGQETSLTPAPRPPLRRAVTDGVPRQRRLSFAPAA